MSLSMIYQYFSLCEWKIMRAALEYYFLNRTMLVDGEPLSTIEKRNLLIKLPSASHD